jgi:hypothetical protein
MNFVEMKLIPHKKWGKKPHNTTKRLVGNPNNLGPKDIQKFA